MLNIEEIVGLDNTLMPVYEKIKSYKAYAFYGFGGYLRFKYKDYVSHFGKPCCIIDKNSKDNKTYDDVPILESLEKAIDDFGNDFCVIVSAPTYRKEITAICEKFLPNKNIFEPLYSICNKNYPQFLLDNKKRIQNFYTLLDDDFSKFVFENWLRFRITYDTKYIELSSIPNKNDNVQKVPYKDTLSFKNNSGIVYYPTDIISFNDEVLFDCGAYTGDNVEDFASLPEFKKIYAFELDKKTFATLCENTKKFSNVFPVNCGIWNKKESINLYSTNGAASSILLDTSDKSETSVIDLNTIDNLASEYEMPTYIKMDIEGVELNALKGAEQTIKNHKPKLAVCLYHKPEDIFEIPEYLHFIRPDYKFFVRHYSVDANELVLFAV